MKDKLQITIAMIAYLIVANIVALPLHFWAIMLPVLSKAPELFPIMFYLSLILVSSVVLVFMIIDYVKSPESW